MTTNTFPARPRDDLPSVARLLTLSDSVVAIALTLLVLQLKVPPAAQVPNSASAADLAAQLAKEADQLISYLIAFYVVAQFWLAHHRVFRRVAGHHEGLAWWNFAFLFTITAMPFTSNLLGEYGNNPLAVDIFAVNVLLATLATQATLLYGRRRDVLVAPADAAEDRARRARVDGGRARRRLVHRPGLGEHQRRQVLLAADPPRTVGGEPLGRPHRFTQKRRRHNWPLTSPVGPASLPGQKAGALTAAGSPSRPGGRYPGRVTGAVTGRDLGSRGRGPALAVHR